MCQELQVIKGTIIVISHTLQDACSAAVLVLMTHNNYEHKSSNCKVIHHCMQHLQHAAAVSSFLQHRSPLSAIFANAGKTVAAQCMLTAVISVYVSVSGHIKMLH